MLGVFCLRGGHGTRPEPIRVAGMGVLCAYVTPGGPREGRRLARAEKRLRRAGVSRILPCRGSGPDCSLPAVGTLPLCRAMADRLVMSALARRAILPQQATVVLRGEYPDGDLAEAAYRLCPRVRQVVIETVRGGEELQHRLYREFGASVDPAAAEESVLRVRFSGSPAGEGVRLCTQSDVADVRLEAPGVELPDFLEPAPALCALWQAGRLSLEQVRVQNT
ncbi:MAG: hypothetical protein E7450_01510 [Ruminococcaceae bacterium]|nr:hypothetical protein [Oscillospiraceae bacterium]